MNSQLLLWQKVVAVMVGLLGGATLAVLGFMVGVIVGGNSAGGYEAGGFAGLFLGLLSGITLCTWKAARIFQIRNNGAVRAART